MPIKFHEGSKTFHIYNKHLSYITCIMENGQMENLYYGKAIRDKEDFSYLHEEIMRSLMAVCVPEPGLLSMQYTKQEYPVYGTGDYRNPALTVRQENGSEIVDFKYISHEIYGGKKKLAGLPATYTENEEEATSLDITLHDSVMDTDLVLTYSVYEDYPVVTRSARLVQKGNQKIRLENVMSAAVEFPDMDYEMIHLSGAWARERYVKTRKLEMGIQAVQSLAGTGSSSEQNPFIALKRPHTTEDTGEVFGFSFVYSGNFLAQVEVSTYEMTRVMMGINPQGFSWELSRDEEFQTPEVVMVYSDKGLNGMSQAYHRLYRDRLMRGKWRNHARPILLNNWEATYFDFDEEKILNIAKKAKEVGVELFVLDDGWFGKRNKDDSSLGDWVVNEEKIKGGLKNLVDKVNEIGLEFGIWFEPEMISPDSNLYKEHPEWAIQIPGREATESRCQYVLDLSRPEVQDYAYESVAKILRSANIKYVKWDMNRQLSDLGSTYLDEDSQQELFHRYVLGMYAMQERLVQEFPDLLLENCSGGGARFDPGMLYYSPQIWCSDDTDAIERLEIQEGTALIYPLCAMGAHVSVCPNHTVGRVTPFTTRGHVALAGTFGYELDITKLPEEERKLIPEQTAMYHKYHELIRDGEYYRILSYRENHRSDCWAVASEDKNEVLVTYVQVLAQVNMPSRKVRLRGFDPAKKYRLEGTDEVYSGEMLMNAGFRMKDFWGDFVSRLYHFIAVD